MDGVSGSLLSCWSLFVLLQRAFVDIGKALPGHVNLCDVLEASKASEAYAFKTEVAKLHKMGFELHSAYPFLLNIQCEG